MRDRGLLVTATDYVRRGDSRAARAAIAAACGAGALPYVSDIDLKQVPQCILHSALDAYARHLEVTVPADAVAHKTRTWRAPR